MRRLVLVVPFAFCALANVSAQDARLYNDNKNHLLAISTATPDLEAASKAGSRRDARQPSITDLPPLPAIALSAAASGSNVLLVYSSQQRSIIALADLDGDGEVDSFAYYIKRVEAPVSAMAPLSGVMFITTYGNTLYSVFTGAGFTFNPPRQEYLGVANADALTYYSPFQPVLSAAYLREVMEYNIVGGTNISIGQRSTLPLLPGGQGAISLARDSKSNGYAITQQGDGNYIWKIPFGGVLGGAVTLAWQRAVPIGIIPGATHLAVDPIGDDLYIATAPPNMGGPGVATGEGGPPPPPEPPPAPISRIHVFKNVSARNVSDPLLFATHDRLKIQYSPAGGIAAYGGVVWVGTTWYDPNQGYQTVSEILQFRAGPQGTAVEMKRFLPAELAGSGFYSGLTLLR